MGGWHSVIPTLLNGRECDLLCCFVFFICTFHSANDTSSLGTKAELVAKGLQAYVLEHLPLLPRDFSCQQSAQGIYVTLPRTLCCVAAQSCLKPLPFLQPTSHRLFPY